MSTRILKEIIIHIKVVNEIIKEKGTTYNNRDPSKSSNSVTPLRNIYPPQNERYCQIENGNFMHFMKNSVNSTNIFVILIFSIYAESEDNEKNPDKRQGY